MIELIILRKNYFTVFIEFYLIKVFQQKKKSKNIFNIKNINE